MKTVEVKFAWADDGNCRVYYKTAKGQLICSQEESHENFIWYTVTNDGCWFEPIGEINMDKYAIKIVKEFEEVKV